MLTKNHIHCVYVVDEALVPIGVVTCTDILQKLLDIAT